MYNLYISKISNQIFIAKNKKYKLRNEKRFKILNDNVCFNFCNEFFTEV